MGLYFCSSALRPEELDLMDERHHFLFLSSVTVVCVEGE